MLLPICKACVLAFVQLAAISGRRVQSLTLLCCRFAKLWHEYKHAIHVWVYPTFTSNLAFI